MRIIHGKNTQTEQHASAMCLAALPAIKPVVSLRTTRWQIRNKKLLRHILWNRNRTLPTWCH